MQTSDLNVKGSEASYTDFLGYLFVITLIFIWKLRSISTTNRKGVNISNPTFNCKKSSGKVSSLFLSHNTVCYSSSARVYTEDREQTQSSLCLLITQKMKKDKSRSTEGWML